MRDIKFRAWDELKTKMHNNFQFIKSGDNGNDWIVFTSNLQTLDTNPHPFDNPYFQKQLKIMQYTGLKDCNGVEIYEGDILKYKAYYNLGHEKNLSVNCVKWDETVDSDGFNHGKHYEWVVGADSLADVADSDYETAYAEIIGNIYENPELLQQQLAK